MCGLLIPSSAAEEEENDQAADHGNNYSTSSTTDNCAFREAAIPNARVSGRGGVSSRVKVDLRRLIQECGYKIAAETGWWTQSAWD